MREMPVEVSEETARTIEATLADPHCAGFIIQGGAILPLLRTAESDLMTRTDAEAGGGGVGKPWLVHFRGQLLRVLRRRPAWTDPWNGETDPARLRVRDTNGRTFWVREDELDR